MTKEIERAMAQVVSDIRAEMRRIDPELADSVQRGFDEEAFMRSIRERRAEVERQLAARRDPHSLQHRVG